MFFLTLVLKNSELEQFLKSQPKLIEPQSLESLEHFVKMYFPGTHQARFSGVRPGDVHLNKRHPEHWNRGQGDKVMQNSQKCRKRMRSGSSLISLSSLIRLWVPSICPQRTYSVADWTRPQGFVLVQALPLIVCVALNSSLTSLALVFVTHNRKVCEPIYFNVFFISTYL